jgi:hypothetical protein
LRLELQIKSPGAHGLLIVNGDCPAEYEEEGTIRSKFYMCLFLTAKPWQEIAWGASPRFEEEILASREAAAGVL